MPRVIFFGLEGALLRGEAQFSFLRWLMVHGAVDRRPLVRALRHYGRAWLRQRTSRAIMVAEGWVLLHGSAVREVERAAEEFFVAELRGRVRRHAASLVAAHRRCGHLTVLVTPAAAALAWPIARGLGLDAVLAAEPATLAGAYTGRLLQPLPFGAGLDRAARAWSAGHGLRPGTGQAYVGRESGRALLEAVKDPFVANPDPALRRLAPDRGWPTIDLDAALAPRG